MGSLLIRAPREARPQRAEIRPRTAEAGVEREREGPRRGGLNDAVLQLQRSVGNQGVQMLLREKWRPVGSLSDEELKKEYERVDRDFLKLDNPGTKRGHELSGRADELYAERERREGISAMRASTAEGYSDTRVMIEGAEAGFKELRRFVDYANERLVEGEKLIGEYLGYYGAAYDEVAKVLEQAKSDAARREKLLSAVAGIVTGTVLGLAAGAVFKAAEGLKLVLVNVAGESAELGAAQILDFSSKADFKLPAGLDPGLAASAEWQQLAQAWKGVALINSTALDFGDYRANLERLAGELNAYATGGMGQRDPDELLALRNRYYNVKTSDKLKERLDEAWAGVVEFSNGLRHPLLRRLQYEIEQDIWIQWISELKGKPGQPQPMGPWGQMGNIPGPFGDPRVSDALDEDAVEERLEKIGVIGEDSILGVDFGWNTTPADTQEAFDAGVKEQRRREQRGRLGVAVTPIGEKETGVVHLRDDAYYAAGRKNPSPGADGYFKAVAWVSGAAKGQVVRVEGSSKGKLEVQPVTDAKPLPVFGYEESDAEKAE